MPEKTKSKSPPAHIELTNLQVRMLWEAAESFKVADSDHYDDVGDSKGNYYDVDENTEGEWNKIIRKLRSADEELRSASV